jgi:hypothetical protein
LPRVKPKRTRIKKLLIVDDISAQDIRIKLL